MVIILMGVSGSGKTTIGEMLAEAIGCRFYDADDFHPESNVDKMSRGVPLTEEDRVPWLEALAEMIGDRIDRGENAVLACSALSARSRRMLGVGREGVELVYLKGSMELIDNRLAARRGHYMPSSLLQSQFETLEEPDAALTIPITPPPEAIVEEIRKRLSI